MASHCCLGGQEVPSGSSLLPVCPCLSCLGAWLPKAREDAACLRSPSCSLPLLLGLGSCCAWQHDSIRMAEGLRYHTAHQTAGRRHVQEGLQTQLDSLPREEVCAGTAQLEAARGSRACSKGQQAQCDMRLQ